MCGYSVIFALESWIVYWIGLPYTCPGAPRPGPEVTWMKWHFLLKSPRLASKVAKSWSHFAPHPDSAPFILSIFRYKVRSKGLFGYWIKDSFFKFSYTAVSIHVEVTCFKADHSRIALHYRCHFKQTNKNSKTIAVRSNTAAPVSRGMLLDSRIWQLKKKELHYLGGEEC